MNTESNDDSIFTISPEEQKVLDFMNAEVKKGNTEFKEHNLVTKSIRVAGYVTIGAVVTGSVYLLAKSLLEE